MQLPHHNRYAFSAIHNRRDYSWPGGKRLAFYVAISIEHFAFGAGIGEDISTLGAPQTQRNFGWRDYGQRVGLWRLIAMLDELKIPLAHAVNGSNTARASSALRPGPSSSTSMTTAPAPSGLARTAMCPLRSPTALIAFKTRLSTTCWSEPLPMAAVRAG